jgi:hypothetical protein
LAGMILALAAEYFLVSRKAGEGIENAEVKKKLIAELLSAYQKMFYDIVTAKVIKSMSF